MSSNADHCSCHGNPVHGDKVSVHSSNWPKLGIHDHRGGNMSSNADHRSCHGNPVHGDKVFVHSSNWPKLGIHDHRGGNISSNVDRHSCHDNPIHVGKVPVHSSNWPKLCIHDHRDVNMLRNVDHHSCHDNRVHSDKEFSDRLFLPATITFRQFSMMIYCLCDLSRKPEPKLPFILDYEKKGLRVFCFEMSVGAPCEYFLQ